MDSFTDLSRTIRALEQLASAIRQRHPDVPGVTITVSAAPKVRGGRVRGYFEPEGWTAGEAKQDGFDAGSAPLKVHHVLIAGERLADGAFGAAATLTHELAHALANAREIKDTSNGHRYHNQKYKELAEELGLVVAHADERHGWTLTELSDAFKEEYAQEIADIQAAIQVVRLPKTDDKEKKPQDPANKRVKLTCESDCAPITIKTKDVWPFLIKNDNLRCAECGDVLQPPADFEDPDGREIPRVRLTLTAAGFVPAEPPKRPDLDELQEEVNALTGAQDAGEDDQEPM